MSRRSLHPARFQCVLLAAFALGVAAPSSLASSSSSSPSFTDSLTRDFRATTQSPSALPFVRIELDADQITYADRLRVRVIVISQLGDRIEWPTLPEPFGGFRVSGFTDPTPVPLQEALFPSTDPSVQGSRLSDAPIWIANQRTITLEPRIADAHELPSMRFAITPASSAPALVIQTNPVLVNVRSVLPPTDTAPPDPGAGSLPSPDTDPGQMRDITPIESGSNFQVTLIITGSLIAASLCVLAGRDWIRRRRVPETLPAPVVAKQRIALLWPPDDAAAVNDPSVTASIIAGLDYALREYLASLDPSASSDRSTPSLHARLSALAPAIDSTSASVSTIVGVLARFDLTRFSGSPISFDAARTARHDVESIIDATSHLHAERPKDSSTGASVSIAITPAGRPA